MRALTIYKTPTCAYCVQVANLLVRFDIPFKTVDVSEDTNLWRKVADKAGGSSVPITYDGKTYIRGWQPYKLMEMIRKFKSE